MDLLLDTHAFIWFISGDEAMPPHVVNVIKDINNRCYISIASIWEITIKVSLQKLKIAIEFNEILNFLEENEIEILPTSFEHLQKLLHLEYHHRDPFDRLIIAQGLTDNLTILTQDEQFSKYPCKIIWKKAQL